MTKRKLAVVLVGCLVLGFVIYRLGRKSIVPAAAPTACTGVTVNPTDNLQNLVNANPAGTTFCLQPGVHHDSVKPKSNDTFTGISGAVENGARLLTNWQRTVIAGTPYWTTAGTPLLYSTQNTGVCQTGYPGCYLSNRLYVNNVSYPSVLSLAALTPGAYYYEANGLNASMSVVNGGSGYVNKDILTVNGGGSHLGGLGSVQVSVDPTTGAVTGILAIWVLGDSYPTTPTIETTTGGKGHGCTFLVTGGSRGVKGNVYVSDAENPNTETTEMAQYGSAFTGQYASGTNPVKNVTIQNLTIEKYGPEMQGGAIWIGWYNTGLGSGVSSGWTVQNNEIRLNHSGVAVQRGGDNARVLSNNIHNDGFMELTVGGATNGLFSGNTFANGNRDHVNCNFGCGFKVTGAQNATLNDVFSHNTVHDNAGPGMWSDIIASGVTYDSNTIYNNDGPGINLEISWHQTVTNNTFWGNGTCAQQTCVLGQGNYQAVLCSHCSDTTISGNNIQFAFTAGGAWGIGINHSAARDKEHPGWTTPANMHVTGNKVIVPTGYPLGRPLVNMNDSEKNFSWQVPGIWSGNCYQVASLPYSATQWSMKATGMTFANWQSGGQDSDGQIATVCP